jgi:hypothetical protein
VLPSRPQLAVPGKSRPKPGASASLPRSLVPLSALSVFPWPELSTPLPLTNALQARLSLGLAAQGQSASIVVGLSVQGSHLGPCLLGLESSRKDVLEGQLPCGPQGEVPGAQDLRVPAPGSGKKKSVYKKSVCNDGKTLDMT